MGANDGHQVQLANGGGFPEKEEELACAWGHLYPHPSVSWIEGFSCFLSTGEEKREHEKNAGDEEVLGIFGIHEKIGQFDPESLRKGGGMRV